MQTKFGALTKSWASAAAAVMKKRSSVQKANRDDKETESESRSDYRAYNSEMRRGKQQPQYYGLKASYYDTNRNNSLLNT